VDAIAADRSLPEGEPRKSVDFRRLGFERGRLRCRQKHRQGLHPRKAARRTYSAGYFGESSARSPQLHGFALSEPAASDGEQSVLGTLLPTDSDKRCRNGVAGSPRQIEVYSRTSEGWGRSRSLFEGEPRKSVDFCRLRFRAPAAPMSSHRQGFWRKQRKKSPIAWPCAVGAAPFGWEQSVPGTPFRRTATTIQERVAVSRQQTEVYAPDPENYGAGPSLMPEGGCRKSVDFRRLSA
jgi:hypothetical protein